MFRSLRLRLPLLLFTFVVGAAGLTLLVALPWQNRAIESRGVEQVRNHIDLVQSGLNTILRHGDLADARNYLDIVMLDPSISRVLLMDSSARVLLDPSRKLEGRFTPAVLGQDLVAVLQHVLETRSGEVRLREDRAAVHGLYPVTLAHHEFSLLPARNGLLFIEHDLVSQKTAARYFMLTVLGSFVAVMGALTALLGLVLDYEITGPVKKLLHTAQAIANGERHARAVAAGSSEFVDLANALNGMTASLVGQQKDLAERELQLRLSHKFSGTGTFEWNIEENVVHGTRHFWMTFFGDSINTPLPYAVGMQNVVAEDRPALDQALHACAMTGAALDIHFRCRDGDGQLHWLHLVGNAERNGDGCARRIVALTRDETNEIVARDHLRATISELEYQKYALDQHSIVGITDAHGIITYVNDKFCAVSGYPRDELLGRSHRLLKSGAHDCAFYQDLWHTITSGQVWRGNIHNSRKDGSFYWVDTSIVPHFDIDGRADSYISIRTDITASVIGEREREHLLQQLYQTQKVEALGLLSGGIAHDFNNLLAAISGHAELAKRRYSGQGEGRLAVYLHEITAAADRGRDLVQRLLTFSHGSPAQAQALPLAGEIRDSLRMLRPLLPVRIAITDELDDATPPVAISAAQVQQIVMNLCINARDAIGGAGRLDVALKALRRQGKCAACGNNFDAHFVSLTIDDSGHGIRHDILDRIFDPFFTTKAVGEGTGLGLSVVHGIVHQTGGHIMVRSHADAGSCFEILLPPCGGKLRRDTDIEAAPSHSTRAALEHSA